MCIGMLTSSRKVTEESILIVQIFDQKKFKKKDQGFLGVINVRIGTVIDLELGGDGPFCPPTHTRFTTRAAGSDAPGLL